jgi:hypothetical protein
VTQYPVGTKIRTIEFLVPKRTGTVQMIYADGQMSNSQQLAASSPFFVEFKTDEGDTFDVWGIYFGDTPIFYFGNTEATLVSTGVVVCDDPTRPATAQTYNFDVTVVCYKSTISTPGAGKLLPLVVKTFNQQ